jgi:hypothetical protein
VKVNANLPHALQIFHQSLVHWLASGVNCHQDKYISIHQPRLHTGIEIRERKLGQRPLAALIGSHTIQVVIKSTVTEVPK